VDVGILSVAVLDIDILCVLELDWDRVWRNHASCVTRCVVEVCVVLMVEAEKEEVTVFLKLLVVENVLTLYF
jgi:hypothetical protein